MRTCRRHNCPIQLTFLQSIHQDRKKTRLLNIDERCKIRYFFLSDYLIKHWIKPFYLVSCLLRILRLRHFLFCRPWIGDSLHCRQTQEIAFTCALVTPKNWIWTIKISSISYIAIYNLCKLLLGWSTKIWVTCTLLTSAAGM